MLGSRAPLPDDPQVGGEGRRVVSTPHREVLVQPEQGRLISVVCKYFGSLEIHGVASKREMMRSLSCHECRILREQTYMMSPQWVGEGGVPKKANGRTEVA